MTFIILLAPAISLGAVPYSFKIYLYNKCTIRYKYIKGTYIIYIALIALTPQSVVQRRITVKNEV